MGACYLHCPVQDVTAITKRAISRNCTIFLADDEGYTNGTMLAPNRMELCYLHVSSGARGRPVPS